MVMSAAGVLGGCSVTRLRHVAFVVLMLLAVLFLSEIRLDDGGIKRLASSGVPSLWDPPVPPR